jgi:glycosyltransferase involved in cell wall biosynthesis
MRRAAVVSARFSPAFVQHAIAYAKAMQALGLEVEFLLDRAYGAFPELSAVAPATFDCARDTVGPFSHAVILNPSARNAALARRMKRGGAKILYLYHEPWNMSWDYLRREGIRSTAATIAAHRVTIPMLRRADTVILGSQYGLELYRQSDIRYNRNACYFPQIYDDEAVGTSVDLPRERTYFSYIGNISQPHAFDRFASAMREFLRRGLDMRFLIASRNPLPRAVARDPLLRQHAEKVQFHCGRPLQSAEINRFYAESICVWNLYRRSTQSGVLPKAFMFGTPVIASALGSFREFVKDGGNGRFASADEFEGILSAIEEIRCRQREYGTNCRTTFLETFYYRSRLGDLEKLLR